MSHRLVTNICFCKLFRIDHCYKNGFNNQDLSLEVSETTSTRTKYLPFELIHHTINAEMLRRMKMNADAGKVVMSDEVLITHLSSNVKTGLGREISHLRGCGLLEIETNGNIKLASFWERKLPVLILNQMMEDGWDESKDRRIRFGLNRNIRNRIKNMWRCTNEGWSFKDLPDKILYYHDVYHYHRQIFNDRLEGRDDEKDGIAQFGI